MRVTTVLCWLLVLAIWAMGCDSDSNGAGDDADDLFVNDATESDFVGCWVGEVTYRVVGGEGAESVEMTFEIKDDSGSLAVEMSDEVDSFESIPAQLDTGAVTYPWPVSEPSNPDCADWDLAATLRINTDGELVMAAEGETCSDERTEADGVLLPCS